MFSECHSVRRGAVMHRYRMRYCTGSEFRVQSLNFRLRGRTSEQTVKRGQMPLDVWPYGRPYLPMVKYGLWRRVCFVACMHAIVATAIHTTCFPAHCGPQVSPYTTCTVAAGATHVLLHGSSGEDE